MKLAHQQLEQHLSKNLAPIYIVSSDELLLVQETVESIRQAGIKAGFTERALISADPGADWSQALHANTHSMSLFSSKQVIELSLHNAKFTAATTKALQAYANKPQDDIVLIVRTNKVDSKTEKSAWFQALEKKSVFISIWPIPAAQLPQWILQRAKKLGVTLSKDGADMLAHQVEGNLLAAAQEIEKLYLLQLNPLKDKNIQKETSTDNARFNVFDLVESSLSGNNSRSLRILHSLAEEDTEPTLILWALTREVRMLTDMLAQTKQGASLVSLFNKFHIFEKRQANVRAFIQRNTTEKCWNLLAQAARVDQSIKGVQTGNVWDELEKMILML
jgi:DNA polymerase-3 subunit delta